MNNSIVPATTKVPEETSFVSQVSPAALQELFERDPENLSDRDIAAIVAELRTQRHRFQQDEAAKAMKEKKPKAKPATKEESAQLSLDDLGL